LKLGTWVHTQRIQYRKLLSGNGKESDKEKTATSGTSSPTAAIDPAYQYTEENASEIAGWSVEQAQSYRLTDERRKRLEEVGFCWSAREGNEKSTLETSGRITRNSYDDQWDAMFDLLVMYKEQRGDCLVVSFFPSFLSCMVDNFLPVDQILTKAFLPFLRLSSQNDFRKTQSLELGLIRSGYNTR
jgi:hypothetical protein